MKDFLKVINEEINRTGKTNYSICDIFFELVNNKYEDELAKLLNNYWDIPFSYKNKTVKKEEADILLKYYKVDNNLLINIIIGFLLATSTFRGKSKLVDDARKYIYLFFSTRSERDILSEDNLTLILKWTIYKFPESKEEISNLLFAYLDKNHDIKNLKVINSLLTNKEIISIFSPKQYGELFEHFFVTKVEYENAILYMQVYQNYLKYLLDKNKGDYKKFLKKYCDYMINNVDYFDNQIKKIELQKVRDYMDEIGKYKDEDYILINKEIEKTNKETLEKLKPVNIPLSKDIFSMIEERRKKQEEQFLKLSNERKIKELIIETPPLIIENLVTKKNTFSELVDTNYLDSTGRVINYKDLNDNQMFSLKARENINISIRIYFDTLFYPFVNSFQMDKTAKKYLRSIFKDSQLVSEEKEKDILQLYTDFFKKRYKISVYEIVMEFEDALRYFFKAKGLNIIKCDGSGDYIGLSNIFNDFEKNSFRDELLRTIDENYYFTLKWLLTDKYGFDLRDRVVHRFNSKNLFKAEASIYTIIQILIMFFCFK